LGLLRCFRSENMASRRAARTAAFCLMFGTLSVAGWAQTIRRSPNQDERDGVSAGGDWAEFQSDDNKMTGAKRVRFELLAKNSFREDPDFQPGVELYCSAGKVTRLEFDPGARLAPPNRPGFWGQPQMEVRVRIDGDNYHQGWNWVNGHFLEMDKGTARGLIGANIFNVEVQTVSGTQIAEFSPAGLRLERVQQACGLKPKKR
jgi:hypothetical protein